MSAEFNFQAIGTTWAINISEGISTLKEAELLHAIQNRIEIFDKNYSRFRDDSLVAEISRTPGRYTMPDDFTPMIRIYRDLYNRSKGLMTPLIGQLLSDAGYDKDYSLKQKDTLLPPPDWDQAMNYDAPYLTTTVPLLLDFGAAGKGYLIDIVSDVIKKNGIHSYTIDAGGDILHKGTHAIRVGMENPDNTTQAIGIINLANKSVAGSSGNRRAWGTFHHIIDPKKLSSPTHIRAIWVVADTALYADAIATYLFFASAHTLQGAYDFEYAILNNDFTMKKSASFPGEIFLS